MRWGWPHWTLMVIWFSFCKIWSPVQHPCFRPIERFLGCQGRQLTHVIPCLGHTIEIHWEKCVFVCRRETQKSLNRAKTGVLNPYGTLRAGDIEGSDVEPTTLRADDFEGRRLWGQTTLRADDFEGRRLWGQVFCTLKIFALNVVCPQCRTTLRANISTLVE